MPFIFKLSGGGSSPGPSVFSGSYIQPLYIVSASLSGGLQLATATGTMPQRLAPADEVFFTSTFAGQPLGGGLVNDIVTDNKVWTSLRTANDIVSFRKSDGVFVDIITGSTTDPTRVINGAEALNMGFDNRMWFASANNHLIGYVDPTTLACEMFSGTISNPYQVVEHTPGKILVRTGRTSSQVFKEFTFAGSGSGNSVTYTGKTTGLSYYDAVPEIVAGDGTCYLATGGNQIVAMTTTTLTGTNVGVATTGYPLPGFFTIRYLQYMSNWKRFVAGNQEYFSFEVTSSQMNSGSIHRIFDGAEWNNPFVISGATSYNRRAFCLDADSSRMWFYSIITPASNVINAYNIRSLRLNAQRARWTWTPGVSGTIQQIGFSGDFSNMNGQNPKTTNWPGQANLGRVFDERTTRFYYSFDGGASRTEFVQSDVLNVPFAATSSITVDAEIQKTPSKNDQAAGWVSHGWIIYSG